MFRFIMPSLLPALRLLVVLLAGAPALLPTADLGAQTTLPVDGDVVVFLVRHAEKVEEGTDDPPLTEGGEERARALADLLTDARLRGIHTTDFRRTRETARPVADEHGLDLRLYDPAGLEELARRIEASPGRHLVVGHSNTTPELVRILGGEPGPPIAEDGEYDRLYVLVLGPEEITTVLLRYGR